MADDEDLDIGMNGMLLEKIVNFCYVGDILDADGGCDSAVTVRPNSWTIYEAPPICRPE